MNQSSIGNQARTLIVAIDYFKNLTDTVTCNAGEVIFDVGDAGDVMYAVREGEVEIRVKDHVLEVCRPGDHFGEMALVDGSPRAAQAVARTEVTLAPVDRQRFLFLVQETPTFALQAMHKLAERVRGFNRKVGEA
jgi:CRP-like cAMP-binding protein